MNLADVKEWAESERDVFWEAYQRDHRPGHAEKFKHYRDVALACAYAIEKLREAGIELT